jgi:hypothetical protein
VAVVGVYWRANSRLTQGDEVQVSEKVAEKPLVGRKRFEMEDAVLYYVVDCHGCVRSPVRQRRLLFPFKTRTPVEPGRDTQ